MQIQDQELADLFSNIAFAQDQVVEQQALNDLIATIVNPDPTAPATTVRDAFELDDAQQKRADALKDILHHLHNLQTRNSAVYTCEEMISALNRHARPRIEDTNWKHLSINIIRLITARIESYQKFVSQDYQPFIDALKISINQLDAQCAHELFNVMYIIDQLRLVYNQDYDQSEVMDGVFYKMFEYYPKSNAFWSTPISALIASIKVEEVNDKDTKETKAAKQKVAQGKQTKTQQWELLKLEQDLLVNKSGDEKNPRDKLLNEFHFQSQIVLTKQDAADERSTLQRIGNLISKWLNNQVDDTFNQEYSALSKELKLTRSTVKRAFGIVLGVLGVLVCLGSIVTLALMYSPVFVGTAIGGGLIALAGVALYKVGKPDGSLAVMSHFNRARKVKTPEPANVQDKSGYSLIQ